MKIIWVLFIILSLSSVIVTVSPILAQEDSSIPTWVKEMTQWWISGTISDDEFLKSIEFLINEGFIEIKSDNSLISNANWRNGVTTEIQGEYILVTSNGIPENDYSDIPKRNPHTVQEQTFQFKFPISPEYVGDYTPTHTGPIGMTLHGAVFFNQFDRDGNDANTRERFDSCNGHAASGGIYHYHQLSGCFEDNESGHSKIFGFVFDGFAMYGYNGVSGVPPNDLDSCNGHTDTGVYHYHATKEYPYLVGCYNGVNNN